MKKLLLVTAWLEAGAGVALICCPSAMAMLLLGAGLDTFAARAVARVARAAVLALAIACWFARNNAPSSAARGLVFAMLQYNVSVVVIFGAVVVWSQPLGVAFWPAIAVHTAMAGWCLVCLLR